MTNLYAPFYRALYYGGYERLRHRTTWRWLELLDASERWPRERLRAFQLAELQHLITHAATRSPYYRALFARLGLRPSEFQCLADLTRIPPIDRETFKRENVHILVPDLAAAAIWKSTGGSTGTPVRFALDRRSNDWRTAAMLRGYRWAGVEEGVPSAHLWSGQVAGSAPERRLTKVKKKAHQYLTRRLYLDIFQLSDRTAPEYLAAIGDFGAQRLVAYGKHLYHLARMIDRRHLAVPPLDTIVLAAEKVTRDEIAVIERVFGCPAYESYGSREFMLIAMECERKRGLHITEENLIVEVLRPDGSPAAPGERGEVVVTDLHNEAMPFIRYRTGDVARPCAERCDCGRAHALIEEVEGRLVDVIRTRDGRLVPGNFFPHLLKEFASVARFQVVQPDWERVEVRIVEQPSLTLAERERIRGEVERVLGPTVRVEIRSVASIPLTPSGKHRVAISEVRDPDAEGAAAESAHHHGPMGDNGHSGQHPSPVVWAAGDAGPRGGKGDN